MLERPGRVDFLRDRPAPSLGWGLLALGCAACVAAGWVHRAHEQQGALRARQTQERQAAWARQQEAAARAAAPGPAAQRRQAAERQLAWPWLDVLRVVESVTEPPVHLLGLMADPATGEVRLEAECSQFSELTDFVQRLVAPGGFGRARLHAHEWVTDTMMGGQRLRFTVLAVWGSQ